MGDAIADGGSELTLALRLGVAVLCGLAVGLEREWSGQRDGGAGRFAGLRTLSLIGLVGGVAGVLAGSGLVLPGAVLLLGVTGLVASAYAVSAARRNGERSAITEVAAIVVLTFGLLAGLGHLRLAAGGAAIVSLALSEKSRLQGWVRSIDDGELRGAFQFAVLALVVLPLLPAEPIAALGGVRPRALWMVVLLFSGLNFVGYVARQAVGASRGYGITGILGGLVSSTAVTFQFSRRSRIEPGLAGPLGFGVLGASTVLLPRVLLASVVLNPLVARELLPYLVPPLLAGVTLVLLAVRRSGPAPAEEEVDETHSPLGLRSALKMALVFQVVLLAMQWISRQGGTAGLLTSAAFVGLTDVDALTLAMSRLGTDEPTVALGARAIAVGVLSNTFAKAVLSAALGSPGFRRVATTGLAVLLAACAAGLWLGAR